MLGQEAGNDVGTEGEGDTAVIFAPSSDVFVGVRPQQIAEQPAIRDLIKLVIDIRAANGPKSSCRGLPREDRNDWLTSVGRMTRRICSIELRSGLRPPCIVKIFSSMIAAIGKQLKQSVKVFHSLMLYLLLHSS